jgi:hypothetical protein
LRDVIDLRGNSVYKWDEMGRECIIWFGILLLKWV